MPIRERHAREDGLPSPEPGDNGLSSPPPPRIARADRIANLDVLRGIAILFILYMNIQYMGDFANPDYFPRRISWTLLDQAAWSFTRLIDGTQRGLLELLFGAGILIMARTAMAPDGPVAVADLHLRRNLWLMAFGIFQGLVLLWNGDILFSYGTAALIAFAFRTLQVRQLLIIGIAVNAVLIIPEITDYTDRVGLARNVAAIAASPAPPTAEEVETLARWQRIRADIAAPDPARVAADAARINGGWPRFIGYHQELWVLVQFTQIGIYFIDLVEAFGTMLIGMALFKLGILQGQASKRSYWLLLAAGYGLGLALRIPATFASLRFDALPDIGMFTAALARLPMTLGHVAAITLALTSPTGRRLLAPFQATGRMPLTIYFSASIAAVVLFGPPLALWGKFGFGALLAIATGIIILQLIAANVWLKSFETGPFEWVWKSLAYNRRQPFRSTSPAR